MLEDVIALAQQAGHAIMEVYHGDHACEVTHKSDNTPVTQADLLAHQLLKKGLEKLNPTIPVLSEEGVDIPFEIRQQWQRYWLIDPLDGTKEFIARTDEFSVNVALIENHVSVMGVIYAPVTEVCYYAAARSGAFKRVAGMQDSVLQTAEYKRGPLRVAVSRRHNTEKVTAQLQSLPDISYIRMGSSLKSCLVAEGQVDVYPRFGNTSEWDTAAAQCIVEEAGGKIIDMQGQPLRYNTKNSLINPWFMVVGDSKIDWVKQIKGDE